jgi:hydroxyquinol 1,2-dioxygenase
MDIKAIAASALSGVKYPPTVDHIEGPFYRKDAPITNRIYPKGSKGEHLHFRGKVTDTDLKPVKNCPVEFWHANEKGRYDNDDPSHLPQGQGDYFCRGEWHTEPDGTFEFWTVLPGNYPIGPNVFRAKHIHFKFYPLGYEPLTTEVVLLPDEYAEKDKFFTVQLGTQLEPQPRQNGRPAWRAYFNFILLELEPQPTPKVGYALQAANLGFTERR